MKLPWGKQESGQKCPWHWWNPESMYVWSLNYPHKFFSYINFGLLFLSFGTKTFLMNISVLSDYFSFIHNLTLKKIRCIHCFQFSFPLIPSSTVLRLSKDLLAPSLNSRFSILVSLALHQSALTDQLLYPGNFLLFWLLILDSSQVFLWLLYLQLFSHVSVSQGSIFFPILPLSINFIPQFKILAINIFNLNNSLKFTPKLLFSFPNNSLLHVCHPLI